MRQSLALVKFLLVVDVIRKYRTQVSGRFEKDRGPIKRHVNLLQAQVIRLYKSKNRYSLHLNCSTKVD